MTYEDFHSRRIALVQNCIREITNIHGEMMQDRWLCRKGDIISIKGGHKYFVIDMKDACFDSPQSILFGKFSVNPVYYGLPYKHCKKVIGEGVRKIHETDIKEVNGVNIWQR